MAHPANSVRRSGARPSRVCFTPTRSCMPWASWRSRRGCWWPSTPVSVPSSSRPGSPAFSSTSSSSPASTTWRCETSAFNWRPSRCSAWPAATTRGPSDGLCAEEDPRPLTRSPHRDGPDHGSGWSAPPRPRSGTPPRPAPGSSAADSRLRRTERSAYRPEMRFHPVSAGDRVIRRIRWSAHTCIARWSPELTSGPRRPLIEAPPRARGWQAPVVPQLMRLLDDSSATHPNRPRADRGVRHHRGPCSLPGGPRPRRLRTRLDSRTAEARGARASGSGHASTPPFRE